MKMFRSVLEPFVKQDVVFYDRNSNKLSALYSIKQLLETSELYKEFIENYQGKHIVKMDFDCGNFAIGCLRVWLDMEGYFDDFYR